MLGHFSGYGFFSSFRSSSILSKVGNIPVEVRSEEKLSISAPSICLKRCILWASSQIFLPIDSLIILKSVLTLQNMEPHTVVGGTVPPNVDPRMVMNNPALLSQALQQIAAHPDEMVGLANQAMAHLPPSAMDQARRMASGAEGKQMLQMMKQKGIRPNQVRMMQKQLKRPLAHSKDEKKTFAALVTSTRKIKSKELYENSRQADIASILHTPSALTLPCPHLSVGPFEGKEICAIFNHSAGGQNRRATRLCKSKVCGDVLFVCDGADLTDKDLETIESTL